MTERDIIELLKIRHSDAICVPHCKTGASWDIYPDDKYNTWLRKVDRQRWLKAGYVPNGPGVMDTWVHLKSWTNCKAICYEVKTSRGDLFGDHKWPLYLDYCNEFFFAVPHGLLSKEEITALPGQAGLIEVTKNGKSLRIKKSPEYRKIEINADVFRYVLMWRAEIKR